MTPLPQLAAPLVGHPLIIVLQLVCFGLGIWLFLESKNRPLVIRALHFSLPFVTLTNVLSRTFRLDWLYLTDIAVWSLMAVSLISAGLYARNENRITAELIAKLQERGIDPAELGLTIAKPDIFTRWYNQILLLSAGFAFGLVSYCYIGTYGEKQLVQQQSKTDVQQEGNRVAAEQTANQQQIISDVASLSAFSQAIIGSLINLQQGQAQLSRTVTKKTSVLQPMASSTNQIKQDVSAIKEQVESPGSAESSQPQSEKAAEPSADKPNLLQRLKKRLFGQRQITPPTPPAYPDSLYEVRGIPVSDSLVLN